MQHTLSIFSPTNSSQILSFFLTKKEKQFSEKKFNKTNNKQISKQNKNHLSEETVYSVGENICQLHIRYRINIKDI